MQFPQHQRRLVPALVSGLLSILLLAACTTTTVQRTQTIGPDGGLLQLGGEVEIMIPPGAVGQSTEFTTQPVAAGLQALDQPIEIPGGPSVPAPWAQVSAPLHILASTVLAKPATLTFHLPTALPGPLVLLTRDEGGMGWHPAASSYDPPSGRLTATVQHFSDWVVVQWVKDRAAAAMKGVYDSLFGTLTASFSPPPTCPAPPPGVSGRQMQGKDAMAWCIESLTGDQVVVHVTNRRHYPVDLATTGAARAHADDPGSLFTKVGSTLTGVVSVGRHLTLLPGNTSGTVTLPIGAGDSAQFSSAVDGEAYLFGVLDVAFQTAALVYGWLDRFGTPVDSIRAQLLDAAAGASCFNTAVRNLAHITTLTSKDAQLIGNTAAACAGSIATDSGVVAFASVVGLAASLVDALVQGVSGTIDQLNGDSVDTVGLRRDAVGRWTDRQLVITTHSLGAVTIGMAFTQAEAASAVKFEVAGDGAVTPSQHAPGDPILSMTGSPVSCLSAVTDRSGSAMQTVSTPEGVRLGGPVAQVKAMYGSRAHDYPGNENANPGIIVTDATGSLTFYESQDGKHTIAEIRAGPHSEELRFCG